MQRAAYLSEAQRYGDPFLPPLTQPLAEIVTDMRAGRVWWRSEVHASSAASAASSQVTCCTSGVSPSRRIIKGMGSAGGCCCAPSNSWLARG